MSELRDALLEQFTSCYDRNEWFVAVRNAIEGLTAEQAAWKPDGADNSIWQTLSHLTFYNFAYLERFKGINYKYPTENNDETFAAGGSDEDWQAEIARFDVIMNEWRELLAAADEGKFDEPISSDDPRPWATLISHINTHNAYHGGQILLLRKMQGSWNPEKGVS